ncbi:hypothetical protein HMPREF0322_03222 [Desulfitobacterium hafniense DP7]|uniref:Uncharacterized protein n=1 Tax=Desulfitobacterium hafniense DP7 TaxID=537010 RepID=G9XQH5_DESHA|nr:hypothetical protein HMPREF0322_03222 [Desulfitobacterium hafniense DP7]
MLRQAITANKRVRKCSCTGVKLKIWLFFIGEKKGKKQKRKGVKKNELRTNP